MNAKKVHVIGGGTIQWISSHLALSAPAYGTTARTIARLARKHSDTMDVVLHLTKMADRRSSIETWDDMAALVDEIIADPQTKIVFFNPAVEDFEGAIEGRTPGKYEPRPHGYDAAGEPLRYELDLAPLPKLVDRFRKGPNGRKDIVLVSFKQTCGATKQEQYLAGLDLLKRTSSNLVFANDSKTRVNMVIVPEEGAYKVTKNRTAALRELVEIAYLRSTLTHTRTTVVGGEPVPWTSTLVPESLRTIVDHCIAHHAYKPVNGATAGHFAAKIGPTTFLSSRRKTDFNRLAEIGLVRVETDGPDRVIAYGSKASVGGQSQRIIFEEHGEYDCIVHFHCPKRRGSKVPTVSQREYECGSHECGQNTSRGLAVFGNLAAVFLDRHGPNIAFHHSIDPQEVIAFIEQNFDLSKKTGGFQLA